MRFALRFFLPSAEAFLAVLAVFLEGVLAILEVWAAQQRKWGRG